MLATSNDITERKHAEALFQSMVETCPDGIGVADLEGRLTYVSPRTLQMFGHASAEAMLGREVRSFVKPDHRALVETRLEQVQQGRSHGLTEWDAVRKDGSTFPLESNGEILRHPDGSPECVFFTIRDITHRKRLERAARWGEKLESLGLMAAGIARELNNAFQVTWSYLELAQGLCDPAGPLAETLGKVGLGIERGTALSAEMLNYSGQSHRQERGLDLGAVARECLAYWEHCLDPRVSLELTAGEGLPRVVGDEGQITKVIGALILNAVEAMDGQPGTVRVSTRLLDLGEAELRTGFWPASGPAGSYLCLELQDFGCGIPEGILDKTCDPFFTTKGPGRGLGLSAALGIVRAHSGCLRILSVPRQGTTVQVCFPVSTQSQAGPALTVPPLQAGQGILVAEDDETIRELVMAMLPRWGFGPVFGAADGAEAVELFREHASAIGLVLTDATMPKMTGPQALEAMRDISPEVKGILMTGYSEALGRHTASSFGFEGFLAKPFKFLELKAILQAVKGD